MTLTINEKEKKAIAAAVTERIDEYLGRFPFARYPIEPLDEWRHVFRNPKTVPTETLKQALGWQLGGWQRKDLPYAHRKTISEAIKAWPDFLQVAAHDPEQALDFWQDKLSDWQHGFGVAAFLLHLLWPDTFEIADRHRLDTMVELLKVIDHMEKDRTVALSLTDLQDYTAFLRSLVPKLPYGKESHIKLDRFIKIYGNRHAYKRISPDFVTREPLVRTFSWNTSSSSRYLLDQIAHRSNADLLFACFLLALEAENRSHEDLTIGEVIDMLPLGTGGLCNPASYNYAMVALFGGQKHRDYWSFHSPELRHAFTEQANQSTRNMRFYHTHASEKLSVNPKYVKAGM
ncbi:hypothetical protein ACFPVX_17340 [Cohnella faecalis]|uniref:Uncharacterized protein n=1 Tax=Cohnella faecalis TaxID=2315694 RepID=A0A398CFM2_9BACL|nr:hypothetical protein [Cohnella faecalis]RIE01523.1 hypothetical protein D3H35_24535 [Cohnella faecalis]